MKMIKEKNLQKSITNKICITSQKKSRGVISGEQGDQAVGSSRPKPQFGKYSSRKYLASETPYSGALSS